MTHVRLSGVPIMTGETGESGCYHGAASLNLVVGALCSEGGGDEDAFIR